MGKGEGGEGKGVFLLQLSPSFPFSPEIADAQSKV